MQSCKPHCFLLVWFFIFLVLNFTIPGFLYSADWVLTSQADFSSGTCSGVDINTSPGEIKLFKGYQYTETSIGNSFLNSGSSMNWRADDSYWQYNLPFAFNFYGSTYTTTYVGSNGFITFDSGLSSTYGDQSVLKTKKMISVFWYDIVTNRTVQPNEDIYIYQPSTYSVCIRWCAETYGSALPVNIELILYQNGNIQFNYGSGNTNVSPTVGISAGDGINYLISSYNGKTSFTNVNSLLFKAPAEIKYAQSGYYYSPVLMSAYPSKFEKIYWEPTAQPSQCGTNPVKFQLATSIDNGMWTFVGPDGSPNSYYTNFGADIWQGHSGSRYLKFKAYFATQDTNFTPTISMVTIQYSKSDDIKTKKWLLMFYMNGDNWNEYAVIDDFLTISAAGFSNDVDIVVQLDRASGGDSRYGDWSDTKRFYITNGITPDKDNAVLNLGELDMGTSTTISNFVEWSITNYPAEKYALFIWNKDYSTDDIRNITYYDYSSWNFLNISELRQSLEYTKSKTNKIIDFIGLFMAFKGNIEIDYELKGLCNNLIASQNSNYGWPNLNNIINILFNHPDFSAKDFGINVVNEFKNTYGTSGNSSCSSTDLSKLDNLITKIDDLADSTTLGSENTEWLNIFNARKQVSQIQNSIDIYDFADNLRNYSTSSSIRSKAESVMSSVKDYVVNEYHGSYPGNLSGKSIYFPSSQSSYPSDVKYTNEHKWSVFLSSYYSNTATPSATTLFSLTNQGSSNIKINWQNNTNTKLDRYCIYQSRTGQTNSYGTIAISTKGTTSIDILGLDSNSIYYFYIAGQNKLGMESSPSSTYCIRITKNKPKILVVCDQNSYPTFYADSLGEYFPFDYCDYNAVDSGLVDLKQYNAVVWYCGYYVGKPGNTSVTKIQSYLENGGNLCLSGAGVAVTWDNSSFLGNYLKASYQSQNFSEYSIVGPINTIFDNKNFEITTNFYGSPSGGAYSNYYPEVIISSGGSTICLKYASGGGAGVQYSGTFGASTTTAKLVYFSFPFECIASRENRKEVMLSIMKYFGFTLPVVSNTSLPTSVKGNSLSISGQAGANYTIYVYVNDELAGTIQCDSSGNFSLSVAGKLKYGENRVKIVTVDSNGVSSKPVTHIVTYSVASENLKSMKVYPNPFMPSHGHREILFAGLPLNCEIKLFNIAGEFVKSISETNNYDSIVRWDSANNGGGEAASGTYIYHIEDKNTGETKTGKLLIIR